VASREGNKGGGGGEQVHRATQQIQLVYKLPSLVEKKDKHNKPPKSEVFVGVLVVLFCSEALCGFCAGRGTLEMDDGG
jgi:hypothetical protein